MKPDAHLKMRTYITGLLAALLFGFTACEEITVAEVDPVENLPNISGFPIVGTNQNTYYNNTTTTSIISDGEDFFGQNANYPGNEPYYVNNGDGTVTDMVTGLMWQSSFDHNGDGSIDYDDKLSFNEILAIPETCTTGGYTDWRVPTIKEQYSLIMFSGRDISGYEGSSTDELIPFINTDFFEFAYGDIDAGERLIDMQCASTNMYVSMEVEPLVFGVNFADGRIKGYGTQMMDQEKAFNYLLVRGNTSYGINEFIDNGDRTITDHATELMWMQEDNGEGVLWKDALSYSENMVFAGHSDWRLPDAKELQSIVDYTRSPASSGTAAIDPLFSCTQITNEAGEEDYPFYWSSTTHANWTEANDGAWGAYVAFGRAMGNMSEMPGVQAPMATSNIKNSGAETNWIDVHGAGAQRSDPKSRRSFPVFRRTRSPGRCCKNFQLCTAGEGPVIQKRIAVYKSKNRNDERENPYQSKLT